jgi:parallel beta-helix repeat protein
MRLPLPVSLVALACATALTATVPAGAATTTSTACAKVASTAGSDSAAGTAAAPYRTVGKLVASLGAGQVGCLRAGTFREDLAIAGSNITLTSYAGERATLVGRLWIKQGANGVTISALDIDGTNAGALPSPTVNGNDAQFLGVDVTNHHTEICFVIGSSWGRAQRTVIKGSRIHDCGKLPSQNQDHGIYVSEADDTQIIDNVIYANADRGIQLYPDAQGTVIRGNIIDGNGEGIIFSGAGSTAASGSIVEGNVLSNATIRTNVESWYPAGTPAGSNNVVRGNCLWQGAGGTQNMSSGGFTMTSNKVVDPQYVNRAAGDFRLKSGSACATYLSASRAPAGLTGQPPLGVDASAPPATPTPDATTPPATPTPDATTPPATTTPDATPPPATTTPGATTPPPTTTPPATTPAKVTYRCTWIRTSTGRRVKRCVAVTVKATAALKRASTRAASSRKHTKKRSATKRSAKASHKA